MRLAHLRFRTTRKGAVVAAASLLTVALVTSACSSSSNPGTTSAAASPATTAATSAVSSAPTGAATSAESSAGSASDTPSASGTASASESAGSSTASSAAPATVSGTLTIAQSEDPGNLDPSMTVLSATRTVAALTYDSLLYQNPDGTFVSGLADSWKLTSSGATFTLHPGVTCSDGSKLTATDVKDNIDYVSDPKNKSPLLGVIIPPGLTTTADDTAGTVTVKTPTPNAFLLNQLTSLFIICKAGLADHKSLAQKTIGTGAFVLTQSVPNDHYTFALNPNYAWAPGGGPLTGTGIPAQVNMRIITNQTTTANLMLSGEVNMATVTGSDVDRLLGAGLKTIDVRVPFGDMFFNENAGRPGADPQVRLALATGSDAAQLTTVATGGRGAASTGLVTVDPKPCTGDTVTGNVATYDAAKAKSILDADGWVAGSDGIRSKAGKKLAVKFIYTQSGGDGVAAAAELLSQEWKDLGVQVTLSAITDTQLNDVLFSSGDWDAGWVPIGVNLPSQLVGFLSGPAPATNFAHLSNATYIADSTKAAATADLDAACKLWNSAEVALVKSTDVLPQFDSVVSTFLKGATVELFSGLPNASTLRLTS